MKGDARLARDVAEEHIGTSQAMVDGLPSSSSLVSTNIERRVQEVAVPGAVKASIGIGRTVDEIDHLADALTFPGMHEPRWRYVRLNAGRSGARARRSSTPGISGIRLKGAKHSAHAGAHNEDGRGDGLSVDD